jgi:hypothetical protein
MNWTEYDRGVATSLQVPNYMYWTFWVDRLVVKNERYSPQYCPENWVLT